MSLDRDRASDVDATLAFIIKEATIPQSDAAASASLHHEETGWTSPTGEKRSMSWILRLFASSISGLRLRVQLASLRRRRIFQCMNRSGSKRFSTECARQIAGRSQTQSC